METRKTIIKQLLITVLAAVFAISGKTFYFCDRVNWGIQQ